MPLSGAFQVSSVTSHTYTAKLLGDYCYGSAVHGGYLASVILRTVSDHFQTTLQHLNQPDTLTLHLEYLRSATAGNADLAIKDVKKGSQTSTLHITLSQGGKEKVAGYATNMDMKNAGCVSYATDYTLTPPPTPADVSKLATDQDNRWVSYSNPYHPKSFTKAQAHLKYVMPCSGSPHPSIMDEWITPTSASDKFTNVNLGFVADQWPQMAENYRPDSPHSNNGIVARAIRAKQGNSIKSDVGWRSPFWYPTLLMNIEFKKLLPPQGVGWLFVRARAKQIKDGRMDVEVTILDEESELVALSNHVCFIVNVAPEPSAKGQDSKL